MSDEKVASTKRARVESKMYKQVVDADRGCFIPETSKEIKASKAEITTNDDLGMDDRLSTGEFAGDFALRYVLYRLSLRRKKADVERKRKDKTTLKGQ